MDATNARVVVAGRPHHVTRRGVCTHPHCIGPRGDVDACTLDDICSGGTCAGTVMDCDDDDPCTDDACLHGVCAYVPNDEPGCDACPDGCDDDNECTVDSCEDDTCTHTPHTDPCDDGDACTEDDACSDESCVGTAVECDDADPCTINESCNPAVGCVYDPLCDDGDPCTIDTCDSGICTNAPIDCDSADLECDVPGTPNTGETEIFGEVESSVVLCAPIEMPVTHRIVTHNTPRARDLHGMLRLSRVSGDAEIVDILYLEEPYALGSPIPVIEPGHSGCDEHTWHSGEATFTLIPRNTGEVTLKAQVDPDPECCEGNGVPTVEAQVTITVIGLDLNLAGLPDEDEEDPGGALCLNADPPYPALTLDVPGATSGTGKFEVVSGDQLIQMYEDAQGTQPVMYFNQTWDVSEFPITRYITGHTRSVIPRDVVLKLTYTGDQGTCEDVVNMTVMGVNVISVDATNPHDAKVNYHIDAAGPVIESATFTAPGTVETRSNITGDVYFTFDQSNLLTGDNTIRLESMIGDAVCTTDVIATRNWTHAPPENTEQETTFVRVPVEGVGLVLVGITHSLWERFCFLCYSAPLVEGSRTLWVGESSVSITTPVIYGVPTEIAGWTEMHLYTDVQGNHLEQAMADVTGPTIPAQGPHFGSKESSDNAFFAPSLDLTGIGRFDFIAFDSGDGLVIPFPSVIPPANEEVDLPLEENAAPATQCP